jgi:hypothetical protein
VDYVYSMIKTMCAQVGMNSMASSRKEFTVVLGERELEFTTAQFSPKTGMA